jgi:hypothetical protein
MDIWFLEEAGRRPSRAKTAGKAAVCIVLCFVLGFASMWFIEPRPHYEVAENVKYPAYSIISDARYYYIYTQPGWFILDKKNDTISFEPSTIAALRVIKWDYCVSTCVPSYVEYVVYL